MASGHSEPRLLYSVGSIHAYHIAAGTETPLTPPDSPQTLSLLMVPTSSPFADLSSTTPAADLPEEDFYLHLHLPPDLDLSLPATTQIYHQPPRSYLIPRWDLGPESGAFTRIEFPKIGTGGGRVTQEDVDTFETILAQCTAFLERANPPLSGDVKGGVRGLEGDAPPEYNPAEYKPGEGYVGSGMGEPAGGYGDGHGHIVLIDEEDGSVVGELGQGFVVQESGDVKPGSKRPVEIELPQEGELSSPIKVTNVSEEYLRMSKHPAYKDSTLVQKAAMASRLIVTASQQISKQMNSGADNFVKSTKPNPKQMTFTPATHERVRKLNSLTAGAVNISAKTVGQVTRRAQNIGATMARRGESKKDMKAGDPAYKPGLLNKSMIAFSTVADGIDFASRHLLASGSQAATQVVGHRYGEDARKVAGSLGGGVKNVGLVYIDAVGVSRKAVLKSVAKGMVVGKAPGGGNLVVGDGDGGAVPPEAMPNDTGVGNDALGSSSSGVAASGKQVGFGSQAPVPEKTSGLGEPLGSYK